MSTTDLTTIEQQRQRRNRINRIKTGIIMTISIWMLVSFLAIVILSVQVIKLNKTIKQLTNTVESIQATPVPDSTKEPVSMDDTQSTEVLSTDVASQNPIDYTKVIKGIDTPDNLAASGDVRKVYLTFNCTPSANTEKILNVLRDFDVKATFFVSGSDTEEAKAICQRIVNEGHTIGMHSYSNQFSKLYVSKNSFSEDLSQISKYLEQVTGQKCAYYRFPGGSSNEISNLNMSEFVHILNQNKITYFDWNVSAGDAAGTYTVSDVVTNVTTGVSKYKTSVVLLHDGVNKAVTVEAISPLINSLMEMDVEILPIDSETKLIQYIKADSVG